MEKKDTNINETLKQYIVVKLGVEQYGINIQYVQNIVRMMNITRVPKAKNDIKGVVNLRGEIIPVMSMRLKFKLDDDAYTNNTRIIFVKVDGNEIGLIVDEVKEVIQLSEESIDVFTQEPGEESNNYVFGVGKVGNALVTLLNIQDLISVNEVSKS